MKQQIELFAKCTGNDNPSYDNIDEDYLFKKGGQLYDLTHEEVDEIGEALANRNLENLVKEVFDLGYFYYQWVSLFERAGIDYKGVCETGCQNNAAKFTTSAKLAEIWLKQWQDDNNFNYYVSGNEVDGEMYYCLKDLKTKKVKKWKGFPQVDLTPFIPNKFKEKSE